jgi:hypothetical protein
MPTFSAKYLERHMDVFPIPKHILRPDVELYIRNLSVTKRSWEGISGVKLETILSENLVSLKTEYIPERKFLFTSRMWFLFPTQGLLKSF